jgi:phenylpropionate dioxygenase-like ring-hydroxylating dioxygenase large terminal subunit
MAGLERALPTSWYLSEDTFRRERERVLYREWFCAGRADQLQRPGSLQVVDVAGESVLVVRTRAGELAAHYNVCRHRGSQVVPCPAAEPGGPQAAPAGKAGALRCPYHSWTYRLEGDLLRAPWSEEIDGFDQAAFGLHPVGVATWGGFVFLHLTPDEAGPLADQLGPVPERLRRYPLEALAVGRRLAYKVRANWKLVAENYNECYHCAGVHPELCRVVPAFKRGGAGLDWDRGIPHREGAWTFTATGQSARAPTSAPATHTHTRASWSTVTSSVSIYDCSPPGTPVRGSSPRARLGCGVTGPCHLAVVFWGLARPRRGVSLPAVVTHERHRGGNSTPLDIPVVDRSGPVTEIAGRVGVAVHELPTGGAHPHPLTDLEVGVVAATAVVGLGGPEPPVGHHQLTASPGALVGQCRADSAKPSLVHAAAKRPPAHPAAHRGDVEVLDHNGAVAAGQPGREGVHLLGSEVRSPPVQGRQLGFRLAVPSGADDPAR